MRTEFALLAIYEKTLIPLQEFCERDMGISFTTAKNQLSAGTFPIKTIKNGRQWYVHVSDAADWIDKLRKEAA